MNREIKFRAFSSKSGMWSWGKLKGNNPEPHPLSSLYSHTGWNVMQYIGLQDMSGRDIYEGDIIVPNNKFGAGTVVFSTPSFGIQNKGGVCTDWEWNEWEKFTVIGNIYENPELINH